MKKLGIYITVIILLPLLVPVVIIAILCAVGHQVFAEVVEQVSTARYMSNLVGTKDLLDDDTRTTKADS